MEKYTEEIINKIITLYSDGVTIKNIIKEIGIDSSRRYIYTILEKNGIKSNRKPIGLYKDDKKKECSKCRNIKDLSKFHKSNKSSDGHKSLCMECKKKDGEFYRDKPNVKERTKKISKIYRDKPESKKIKKEYYFSLVSQYHQYKKRAKKANMVFELTKEDCEKYYKTKCYYCGDKIKGLGIDRVKNDVGYVIDNCVPCCSVCNFMKHIQNVNDFFLKIEKIYKKHVKT